MRNCNERTRHTERKLSDNVVFDTGSERAIFRTGTSDEEKAEIARLMSIKDGTCGKKCILAALAYTVVI